MKLLTEMRHEDGKMYAHDPDPYQTKGAVARDAMAAHALMQAIKEWWDLPPSDQCADGVVTWIEKRADDIMTGWTGAGE